MNRFLIDHHPDAIAKAMCDKHIVKMPTEEAQMLSHVLHHYLGEEGETMKEFTAELGLVNSPPAHAKHPCTEWAAETRANYLFSVDMLRAMSEEYTHRYGKTHKCSLLLPFFLDCAKYIPYGHLSKHPQCFGEGNDHLKTSEIWPVQAYRNYYRWKYQTTEWCGKYKLREVPRWLKESMI